jgi:hypothetical protein
MIHLLQNHLVIIICVANTPIRTRASTHTHTYTHTRTHAYIYIHTHTHMHKYIQCMHDAYKNTLIHTRVRTVSYHYACFVFIPRCHYQNVLLMWYQHRIPRSPALEAGGFNEKRILPLPPTPNPTPTPQISGRCWVMSLHGVEYTPGNYLSLAWCKLPSTSVWCVIHYLLWRAETERLENRRLRFLFQQKWLEQEVESGPWVSVYLCCSFFFN